MADYMPEPGPSRKLRMITEAARRPTDQHGRGRPPGAALIPFGLEGKLLGLLLRQKLAQHPALGFGRLGIGKFPFEQSQVFGVDEPFHHHGLPSHVHQALE